MTTRFLPLRPILAALILCLPAPLPSAHAAAPIDEAGAARLKIMLENLIDTEVEDLKARGLTIQTDGPVKVDQANGYYAATLPAYAISDPESGLSLSLGRIAINASASDAPRQWNMAVALPTPIRMKAPDIGDFTLSLGGQRTSGVWHEDLRNFVKLDSRIENVRIEKSSKDFMLAIPSVVSVYNLTDKGGDSWSGPANILAKGLTMTATSPKETGPITLAVDEIGLKSTVRELSIKAMAQYRDQMEALSATAQTDPNRPISPAHAEAMARLLSDVFRKAWDGGMSQMSLRGLQIRIPAHQTPAGAQPAQTIQLQEGHFGFDMGGLRSGKVALGLSLGHSGLYIDPEPEDLGPLTPTAAALNVRLENLPFGELVDLGLNSFKMAQQMPGMEQMVGFQILGALPKLMSTAGTKVSMEENHLTGKLYDVLINGHIMADSTAANGLTAKGRMEIAGFEAVMAHLNAKLEKSTGDERESLASFISNLTTLQALGQQSKNATGQPIHTYDFAVDPKGRMLLNGADFNALSARQEHNAAPKSVPPTSPAPRP